VRDNKWHDESAIPESIVVDFHTIGGNSGGPVIDYNGNVIGILSWGLQNVSAGYDFSLNGSISSHVAEQIYLYFMGIYDANPSTPLQTYPTGYLGISYVPVDLYEIRVLGQTLMNNVPVDGVIVTSVRAGSPAQGAGLRVGDLIIEANGLALGHGNNHFPLGTIIHFTSPGSSITLKLRRSPSYNSVITLSPITLGALPSNLDIIFSPLQKFENRKMIK
jgi:S1-C subfamily serine protease